jgi:hypothetical protein
LYLLLRVGQLSVKMLVNMQYYIFLLFGAISYPGALKPRQEQAQLRNAVGLAVQHVTPSHFIARSTAQLHSKSSMVDIGILQIRSQQKQRAIPLQLSLPLGKIKSRAKNGQTCLTFASGRQLKPNFWSLMFIIVATCTCILVGCSPRTATKPRPNIGFGMTGNESDPECCH